MNLKTKKIYTLEDLKPHPNYFLYFSKNNILKIYLCILSIFKMPMRLKSDLYKKEQEEVIEKIISILDLKNKNTYTLNIYIF